MNSSSRSSTSAVEPSLEALAAMLPEYRIESVVDVSEAGTVYHGVQHVLDRPVAIRVLAADLSNDHQFVERFQREARALATLQHPGIVGVFDIGQTTSGNLYFVMEHVDGISLTQMIQRASLAPAQALDLTVQICDALHHAHSQGIVHRALNPDRILVTGNSRAKLMDFGLARPLSGESAAPKISSVSAVSPDESSLWHFEAVGKQAFRMNCASCPDYMAPEQLKGFADQRTDIYALGVLLYEMLTGMRPEGFFLLPSAKSQADARLDQIVIKALQHEPERRYQQVSEMKTDVDRVRSTSHSYSPFQPSTAAKEPSAATPGARKQLVANATLFYTASFICLVVVASLVIAGKLHRSSTSHAPINDFEQYARGLRERALEAFNSPRPVSTAPQAKSGPGIFGTWTHTIPSTDSVALPIILRCTADKDGTPTWEFFRQYWSYQPVFIVQEEINGNIEIRFKMVGYTNPLDVSPHRLTYRLTPHDGTLSGELIESWKPEPKPVVLTRYIPSAEAVSVTDLWVGETPAAYPEHAKGKPSKPEREPLGPTEIVAGEETFDPMTHSTIFLGDVAMTDPEFHIQADKLTAYIDDGANEARDRPPASSRIPTPKKRKVLTGLQMVIAEADPGKVVTVTREETAEDGSISRTVGHGRRFIIYDLLTGELILAGTPDLRQGPNTTVATDEATRITVKLDEGSCRVSVSGPHKIMSATTTPIP